MHVCWYVSGHGFGHASRDLEVISALAARRPDLRFIVRTEFLNQYEIHIVGSAEHQEYWIPAGDLHRLNENIVGAIEVISEFRREG